MSTGKLGSVDLLANTDTVIATTDEPMVVNVRLVNRGSSSAAVRVAIGTGLAPTAADYIEYDAALRPNGVLENSGLALSVGEKIWVRSDVAAVSARAHGIPAS